MCSRQRTKQGRAQSSSTPGSDEGGDVEQLGLPAALFKELLNPGKRCRKEHCNTVTIFSRSEQPRQEVEQRLAK